MMDYEKIRDSDDLDAYVANGADHLGAIYEMLSGQKPINVGDLYFHMDELAGTLRTHLPYKPEHEDYLHSRIL